MNSIEDLLNSLLQNSPDNTVRAASGGLMGSPMQNSPAQNSPMQSNPMANALTMGGGMQPSNAMPFGQMQPGGMQPNYPLPSYTPTGPTPMQPGSMAGGGFSGNVNGQSSRFGPMAPLSTLSKEEAFRQHELANYKNQPMPQMGGMSPSYGGGIGSLMPQQSPYGEQPKQQEMQALMEERRQFDRRRQFDQQHGGLMPQQSPYGEQPNPYQTATPLDPNDPMLARTRGVGGGQQRMNPIQQLMGASRGMRAATQPYTPVQGQRLTPGQTPQNPMFSRTPGNFAMPVQGQNNTAGKQSLSDLLNASNVSAAGRRRLV
jgi:hypothetical protein